MNTETVCEQHIILASRFSKPELQNHPHSKPIHVPQQFIGTIAITILDYLPVASCVINALSLEEREKVF